MFIKCKISTQKKIFRANNKEVTVFFSIKINDKITSKEILGA
jgi:hypothetical protein